MKHSFFKVVPTGDGAFEVITANGERVASSPDQSGLAGLALSLNKTLDDAKIEYESIAVEDEMQVSQFAVDCINCARFGMGQVVSADDEAGL